MHRIHPYVVLVLDGVEHKVDVIIAVFNPRPEFSSAFQYITLLYIVHRHQEFATKPRDKREGNICARDSRNKGTPKITAAS